MRYAYASPKPPHQLQWIICLYLVKKIVPKIPDNELNTLLNCHLVCRPSSGSGTPVCSASFETAIRASRKILKREDLVQWMAWETAVALKGTVGSCKINYSALHTECRPPDMHNFQGAHKEKAAVPRRLLLPLLGLESWNTELLCKVKAVTYEGEGQRKK